jgi:hypothetical protein
MVLAGALVALVLGGCATYRKVMPPQQMKTGHARNVDILLRDGRTYRLEQAEVAADSIRGVGLEFVDDATSVPFDGAIATLDIAVVQFRSRDWIGPLIAAAASVAVTVAVLDKGEPDANGFVHVYNPQDGGGMGSCPFIYAFDGLDYRLEAESFVGSVCAELEQTTRSVLPSLAPVDGALTVAMCNQSLESQYVDTASLFAVDHPLGTRLVIDSAGGIRAVASPEVPVRARNLAGTDVTLHVSGDDHRLWTTDPATIDPSDDATLRDGLVCEFPRPSGDGRALLVLRARNTRLAEFGVHKLLTLCGPQKLAWCRDLGRDPLRKGAFAGWMVREGALLVQVKADDGWRTVGFLPPVGAVMTERAVEVDFAGMAGANVEVRLLSGAGIWSLDRVGLAPASAPVMATAPIELPLKTLRGASAAMTAASLATGDDSRLPLMPGDWAVLGFACPDQPAQGQYSYILRAGGYYYPWLEEGPRDQRDLVARIMAEPLLGSRLFIAEGLTRYTEAATPVAPRALPRPVAAP